MNKTTNSTMIVSHWTHALAWLPAAGLLAGGALTSGAQPADPPEPPSPAIPEVRHMVLERRVDETGNLFSEDLRESVNSAMRQAEAAIAKAADVGRAVAFNLSSAGTPRTLVLPGPRLSAEQAAQLNEDLAVMSRILDKAVRGESGARPTGFSFDALNRIGRKVADAFYLGGFGALFLVNVDFPLVAAPKAGDEEPPPAGDTTWEEARRELQQGPGSTLPILGEALHSFRSGGSEFRPSAVEELRKETLQALKHASNIRGLADSDRVAVAVFGPAADGGQRREIEVHSGNPPRNRPQVIWNERQGGGSIIAFQATKADIDAFARGGLDDDDFAKRVTVTSR